MILTKKSDLGTKTNYIGSSFQLSWRFWNVTQNFFFSYPYPQRSDDSQKEQEVIHSI